MAHAHQKLRKNASVGFCVLSHNDSGQAIALVQVLNQLYDNPPIVIHHDWSQSSLDPKRFPSNVSFVTPYIPTGWGRISVVQAGLKAIERLYKKNDPDWFFLLSSSDYPLKNGPDLYEELSRCRYDAFIDVRPLLIQKCSGAMVFGEANKQLNHFGSEANFKIKSRFYLSREFWLPLIRFRPRLRLGRFTVRSWWVMRRVKKSGLNIFYGDHWFTGNRLVAQTLIARSEARSFLLDHLRMRPQVDECFYQTIIMNSPDLRVCRDNRRFAEWNGGGAHPMNLTMDQVKQVEQSHAFFARKVDPTSFTAKYLGARLHKVYDVGD